MKTTLRVLCAGAVKSVIADLASAFERDTGHGLEFAFGTVGDLQARVMAGEDADVLVLARPALEKMASLGKVRGDNTVDLGRVGVGIAVRVGAISPDVSTPGALRRALLSATSLVYGDPAKGDSSGIHFAKVLEQLGIAPEVNAKTVLAPVGLAVAEMVDKGEVTMGATQASVIVACRGIRLAGLLPAELQHTTTYSASITTATTDAETAMRFLGHLATPSAKSCFRAAGFEQAP